MAVYFGIRLEDVGYATSVRIVQQLQDNDTIQLREETIGDDSKEIGVIESAKTVDGETIGCPPIFVTHFVNDSISVEGLKFRYSLRNIKSGAEADLEHLRRTLAVLSNICRELDEYGTSVNAIIRGN